MARKKSNNEQFNCRVNPAALKGMRKIAKKEKVRLGVVVEQAFIKFIESQAA